MISGRSTAKAFFCHELTVDNLLDPVPMLGNPVTFAEAVENNLKALGSVAMALE